MLRLITLYLVLFGLFGYYVLLSTQITNDSNLTVVSNITGSESTPASCESFATPVPMVADLDWIELFTAQFNTLFNC
ncbi:MAG: hypothetical protein EBU90_04420 [Proteobacteria bacterium]|nr:hypothetical protein [Pseudomonadota bacterium]NBP15079.1 hypothetical protein [bacterium]